MNELTTIQNIPDKSIFSHTEECEAIVNNDKNKKRLNELSGLQYNWDDEGAEKPDIANIDRVRRILDQISSKKAIDNVFIAACRDGSIDLDWSFDNGKMLINISSKSPDTIGIYAEINKEKLFSETILSSKILDKIERFIERV